MALRIVKHVEEKNWRAEAEALHAFCRDRIRYVKDVFGVETIQTPLKTLELGQGDCDDKTTLFCSLALALGHPCRMVAVKPKGAPIFTHVLPETKIGAQWVAAECTQPWPLGKFPPNIQQRMYAHC